MLNMLGRQLLDNSAYNSPTIATYNRRCGKISGKAHGTKHASSILSVGVPCWEWQARSLTAAIGFTERNSYKMIHGGGYIVHTQVCLQPGSLAACTRGWSRHSRAGFSFSAVLPVLQNAQ